MAFDGLLEGILNLALPLMYFSRNSLVSLIETPAIAAIAKHNSLCTATLGVAKEIADDQSKFYIELPVLVINYSMTNHQILYGEYLLLSNGVRDFL